MMRIPHLIQKLKSKVWVTLVELIIIEIIISFKEAKNKKCYCYGKIGHFIEDCFKKANDQENGSNLENGSLAIAAFYKEAGANAGVVYVASTERIDQNCVLDSGCSFHLSPNLNWFSNFSRLDGGFVNLGNMRHAK